MARFLDLSRIPVNKKTNSRLGWTKYSDLYEIVHPSLVLFYVCLLEHNAGKVYSYQTRNALRAVGVLSITS